MRSTSRTFTSLTPFTSFVSSLPTELRFALRSLRSTPAFTAVALVVLALGVGATTAIYSIVDAVALKGMPFPQSDRVMIVTETNPSSRGLGGGSVAAPNFYDWRDQQKSFESLAAFQFRSLTVYDPGREPEALRGQMVSANLFSILRASPIKGSVFAADHEVAGRNRVVVISARLWKLRYANDPQIVGKTLNVGDPAAPVKGRDDGPWEILGVMPDGFEFPVGALRPADFWVPYVPPPNEYPRGDGSSRNYNAQVVGRLKDGVGRWQAYDDMARITLNLAQQYPRWFRDRWVAVMPLKESVVGQARGWMFLLLGSVAFVLLIACVNVANLMLARATARKRDIGVRAALGATRWQLARGLLVESLLLSVAGTALGVLAAYWGIEILRSSLPASLPRLAEAGLNLRVLLTTAFVALATGVAFGILPALRFSRPQLTSALGEGRMGHAGAARERARSILLVAEVALAVVLLIGAGLFVSSFVRLTNVDLGINTENVLTQRVSPRIDFNSPTIKEDQARAAVQIEDVFERVKRINGIEVAAFLANGSVPLAGGWSRTVFEIPGGTRFTDDADAVDTKSISADYFKALGIPVINGREFTEADRGETAGTLVIINDVAAKRFFGDENPVGRQVKVNGDRTIVGVVRAVREGGPEAELRPGVFTPASRSSSFGASLILKTSRDPATIKHEVRAVVRSALPNVVVADADTFDTMYGRLIAQRKFNMLVLALFGVLAIVIAAVGIYGVMGYLVTQRTQEIGIRMALGARPRQVLGMVLSRAALLMTAGVAVGLVAGWMLSKLTATFLFRVEPHDAVVYIAAAAILMTAGILAAWLPARRAARIDPMLVLK